MSDVLPAPAEPPSLDPVADAVHERVLEVAAGAWAGWDDERRRAFVADLVRRTDPLLDDDDATTATDRVLARTDGLGVLEPLLADPEVTEVMVNGGRDLWVERRGRLEQVPAALDPDTVRRAIERIVAPLGLRIDRSSPLVDARLPDGSRVNAVVEPLAVDGPCLTIRRFGVADLGLDRFAAGPVVGLLAWAVAARANVVVSGGTGAGKTTLLNALAALLPRRERIITIEDTAELRLPGDHVVRLEARPANADGAGERRIRELVRNALRMRPDRLVVGEVRGDEALDMLWAMNTGHEGSLSTCHANGPTDALRRLETMVVLGGADLPLAAVRDQLVRSIDLVVQVARREGGDRRIVGVHEVLPTLDPSGAPATRPLADGRQVLARPVRAPRDPAAGPPPEPDRLPAAASSSPAGATRGAMG